MRSKDILVMLSVHSSSGSSPRKEEDLFKNMKLETTCTCDDDHAIIHWAHFMHLRACGTTVGRRSGLSLSMAIELNMLLGSDALENWFEGGRRWVSNTVYAFYSRNGRFAGHSACYRLVRCFLHGLRSAGCEACFGLTLFTCDYRGQLRHIEQCLGMNPNVTVERVRPYYDDTMCIRASMSGHVSMLANSITRSHWR